MKRPLCAHRCPGCDRRRAACGEYVPALRADLVTVVALAMVGVGLALLLLALTARHVEMDGPAPSTMREWERAAQEGARP